jgi:predicted enzyme related to lactoylglutathione lyase
VFFKAADTAALQAWYREHLGLEPEFETGTVLHWRSAEDPDRPGTTTWALFASDSDYFGSPTSRFMVNYRVSDLDAMLTQLRAAGVTVDEHVEDTGYGRFGWAVDLEGNRFELWQPAEGM